MSSTERHHGADLAKWLGLVLMVLDHAWYVVPAEWQDVYEYVERDGIFVIRAPQDVAV